MARSTAVNWQNLITVVSMLILVGTEVFGVALAGGWAIAGLFELGELFGYVLMGLLSLVAAYIVYLLWRRAVRIEPLVG